MNKVMPRVLYLEDDLNTRDGASRMLRRKGFIVEYAATGGQAIRMVERDPDAWDAFIFDSMLDDHFGQPADRKYRGPFAGLDVLKEIQQINLDTPAYVLTSFYSEVVEELRLNRPELRVLEVFAKRGYGARTLAVMIAQSIRQDVLHQENERLSRVRLDDLDGLQDVLEAIRSSAVADQSVLLVGPPGVGKESLAHYYYYHSARLGSLQKVAAGSLDGEAMTHALCGRAAGFPAPGSKAVPGAFEEAGFGVVYISDVDKFIMNSGKQPSPLFNALGDHAFINRMGSTESIPVNCTVVMSVNHPDVLHDALLSRFRRIDVPALSERPQDIAPLAEFLVRRHVTDQGGIYPDDGGPPSAEELEILHQAPLPGNVRDLKQWAETRVLPTPAEESEVPTSSHRRISRLDLTITMDHRGKVDYEHWLGQSGKLKEAVLRWLAEELGSFDEVRRVTGMKSRQLQKALERFEIVLPDSPDDLPSSGDARS